MRVHPVLIRSLLQISVQLTVYLKRTENASKSQKTMFRKQVFVRELDTMPDWQNLEDIVRGEEEVFAVIAEKKGIGKMTPIDAATSAIADDTFQLNVPDVVSKFNFKNISE